MLTTFSGRTRILRKISILASSLVMDICRVWNLLLMTVVVVA